MSLERREINGSDVLFVKRDRFYAFITEHEIILIPRKKGNDQYPVQVKRFSDGPVKATTTTPGRTDVKLYREIDRDIWSEYLNPLGYYKEYFMDTS